MLTSKPLLLTALTCVIAGVLGASLLVRQTSAPPTAAPTALPGIELSAVQASQLNRDFQRQSLNSTTPLPPLPRSLRDTHHDVRLRTDAAGNLQISADILHLFEFYLSALLEEPLETVLTRISLDLASQLQGPALEQARDLLGRYIDYKIALIDLDKLPVATDHSGYALDSLAARQLQLRALRQQYFSAEETGVFFQEEDLQDDFMLEHLAVAQDASLDEAERQARLARLEQQLPESIRQGREQATRHSNLYETTEAMKQNGASAAELYRVRAETLGAEAATALAELDRQHAEWDRRVADYQRERAAIVQSGLSQQDRQAAIERLIAERFEGAEQRQVKAMEMYQ
jgi:lipase chaperone LimK